MSKAFVFAGTIARLFVASSFKSESLTALSHFMHIVLKLDDRLHTMQDDTGPPVTPGANCVLQCFNDDGLGTDVGVETVLLLQCVAHPGWACHILEQKPAAQFIEPLNERHTRAITFWYEARPAISSPVIDT